MKVMEVVKLAAQNLGRQDLSDSIDALAQTSGDAAETEGETLSDEIKSLVRCFNLVENEVALDYFPLKKEEAFTPVSHTVPYTEFSASPVDVQKVTDEGGRDVEFEIRSAHLYLPKEHKKVVVTYSYVPALKTLGDESEFSGKITPRLLSFGVAGEFCLSASRFQEAAMWERRFLDALKAASLIRKKLSMRARRWI